MKLIGIYKITSPIKRIYIGQSLDILQRWDNYKKLNCKFQVRLYRSLKKYGWDKHKFEIICQCDESELNNLEKYYVDLFGTFNSEYGMNLKDGGGSKGMASDETKRKMSKSQKGRKHSEETKRKMREWHIGKVVSEETKDKIRDARKKQVITEEHKRKIGKWHKGRKFSEEMKSKMRDVWVIRKQKQK